MSNIAIQTVRQIDYLPRPMLEEIESHLDRIRGRAYELFQTRGGIPGRDLDDWLQAEREIGWLPETDMMEQGNEIQARINVPRLEPKDVRLLALPNAFVIEGQGIMMRGNMKMLHYIALPRTIDPERVQAHLERGTLYISAPKSAQERAAFAA